MQCVYRDVRRMVQLHLSGEMVPFLLRRLSSVETSETKVRAHSCSSTNLITDISLH